MATAQTSTRATFDFEAANCESEFRVIGFHGSEALSELFYFEIELISEDSDVNLGKVLQGTAKLSIRWEGKTRSFEGVLSEFEQLDRTSSDANYRAILVPRLWRLAITHQSRIFQNRTIPQILDEILREHGITSADYVKHLAATYPTHEYVVQYQETDLNFIARWLEHEGIFYFHQDGKLVFGDSSTVHQPISDAEEIPYRPQSGMVSKGAGSVHSLVCRQRMLPGDVALKDYNWREAKDHLLVHGMAARGGTGTFMEYGNHYKDTGDGGRLAKVRGEEFACRQRLFLGGGDCRAFQAGFKYKLAEHYREEFNQEYLLAEVSHFGRQTGASSGRGDQQSGQGSADYRNEFVSVPADVSFRPERKTPKPRMHGTMNAKIDGAGSGEYAELDDQGRYKVIMPFDLSGKGGGGASRWMRMAQPYAGSEYGMHFPLHKGTEVIWSCIDGDPDRPIICGAVPNPETVSPVTSRNQTKSVVRDYGGNEIILEGLKGKQQIRLFSPTHNTVITLGNSIAEYTESDISLQSSKAQIQAQAETKITLLVGASQLEMNKDGTITLTGKHINIVADQEIRLEVGGSGIQMTPDAITEVAGHIDLNP